MTKKSSGKWNVESAISMIKRNGGSVGSKSIHAPQAGIKVLGAVDFLVNYCGFYIKKEQ